MRPIVPGRIIIGVRDTKKASTFGFNIIKQDKQIVILQVEPGKEEEECVKLRKNPIIIFAEPSHVKHMRNAKWRDDGN